MQNITIAGNVGKDPVLRRTNEGDPILSFSVAVSNGRDAKPTWFDVSVFGKRAMSLDPIIGKGTSLTVNGRLSSREHEGRTYLQVAASEITLQGGKRDETIQPRQQEQQHGGRFSQDLDDDLPF